MNLSRRNFLHRLAVELPPRRSPALVATAMSGRPLLLQFHRNGMAALMESFRTRARRTVDDQQLDLRDFAVVVALVPRQYADTLDPAA